MVDIEEVIIKNKNLTDDVIDTFREGYGEDIAELFLIQRSLVQEVKWLRGIWGDIIAIDEWGGDGKDVGITITYGEGYRFTGWIDKDHTYCVDEEGKVIE